MLKQVPGGYRLSVHATAAARRDHVGGCHDQALRVSVTAAPDKGKANRAIRKALARALGIKQSQMQLVAGETHRRKQFMITDAPAELLSRVAELGSID
tara:strand:+ start:467235 stop:467528 length:294 start_codon:yes stop_codon:yes gene_type:complete